jgi:formylglycine-generating enzyme required for sulfatase activity
MKLVLISAGRFTMGSPKAEVFREKYEDQHEVEITKDLSFPIFELVIRPGLAATSFDVQRVS